MTADKLLVIISYSLRSCFAPTDIFAKVRCTQSLADLSLSIAFRRQWSNIYEALQDTRPDRQQLIKLYIAQIPQSEQIVLAADSRVDSRNLLPKPSGERTYYHSPSPLGDCRVTVGYCYSTLAWIPETEGRKGCTSVTRTNYQLGQSHLSLVSSNYRA
jgi:hypothetical protein